MDPQVTKQLSNTHSTTHNNDHKKAIDFILLDENGQKRSLSEFLKNGAVVLVFYPGDFTPVCTTQLCSYNDSFQEFENLGIQLIGISQDSPDKHKLFKEKYRFKFPLLSDPGKKVAKQFGATSKWLLGAVTRANFVISKNGDIVWEHVDGLPVTHQKFNDLKNCIEHLKKEGLL